MQSMADGCSTITFPVPPEALARLKAAEMRQRNETRKRGLTAVPVSVEGLCLLQMKDKVICCGCPCGEPLDFTTPWDDKNPPLSYPVIAHVLARGSRGEHTPRNVQIHRWACNKRDASADTSGAASVKRFTPDYQRRLLAKADDQPPLPNIKARISKSPGSITSGGVSVLSKKHPNYKRPKWPSRAK